MSIWKTRLHLKQQLLEVEWVLVQPNPFEWLDCEEICGDVEIKESEFQFLHQLSEKEMLVLEMTKKVIVGTDVDPVVVVVDVVAAAVDHLDY